jgi:hypothetical protein
MGKLDIYEMSEFGGMHAFEMIIIFACSCIRNQENAM